MQQTELPPGWVWAEANDICRSIPNGNTPPADRMQQGSGEIPFIKVYNLTKTGRLDFSINPTFIDRETHESKLSRSRLAPGDVLVNIVGPPLGKVSIVPDDYPEWNTNQAVVAYKANSSVLPAYMTFWLLNPLVTRHFEGTSKATAGQFNVAVTACRALPVPLPPLNEQHRIVAKIEALLARTRKAREALEAIAPLLDKFRQSVLATAFRGDLTAEWRAQNPDVEPASVLLERIHKERRRKWEEDLRAKGKDPNKAKYQEPESVDDKVLPELPEGWCWSTFGQTASIETNLVDPTEYRDRAHIAPNHIESMTGRLLEYTTIAEDGVTSPKHHFFSGQILYSKIRPYLCKAVLVDFSGLCSADMYPVTAEIDPQFLLYWILSDEFTWQASLSQGRTVLPKINQNALVRIPVPVPPLSEQRLISRILSHAFQLKRQASQSVNDVAVQLSQLEQSILAKAFRGELVPQDPNDEPASVLLDRIRGERASAMPQKGRKKAMADGGVALKPRGRPKKVVDPLEATAVEPNALEDELRELEQRQAKLRAAIEQAR